MKKLLLAFMGIAFVAGSAMAQDYEKNLYGVRVGMNVANISASGFSADSKVGFHVAGVYQRLLMAERPLYLETGLQLSQKGFKFGSEDKYNTMYLEVPVMVNYKFNIKDIVSVYPSVGFYYAFGVGGKNKETFEGETEKYDMFGDMGYLKRSDFGMRFSGTVDWKCLSFSLGYEFGFVNIYKEDPVEVDEYGISAKMKTGNFFLSIGYNF